MSETRSCALLKAPQLEIKGLFFPERDDPRLVLQADEQDVVLSARVLLECLYALELQGDVPVLPDGWWKQIHSRYIIRDLDISRSLEDMSTSSV
ncbi:hypothetical protein [Acidithiobacillus ferrooxidans]|jgi:hypothetical protein|uniref:hypothetical protein n=1 Tax=Acidithiobacillus ferrooxidans TaxID=920 RepID=UPI000A73BC24|nr:hypothetical protein [Acidithiobacillus ferrooxidans]